MTIQTLDSLSCGSCGHNVRGTMMIKIESPDGEAHSGMTVRFDHCGDLQCVRSLFVESYTSLGVANPEEWFSSDVFRLSESFQVEGVQWTDNPHPIPPLEGEANG